MKGLISFLRSPWFGRTPLIAVAVFVLIVNGINIARHYELVYPHDPFEAAETVEGWRSAHGIPVYDPAPNAHATHMYGALAPWTIGKIFQFVEPNNQSGRLITLISSLIAAAVLVLTVSELRARWFLFVAFGLFFGLNRRSANYFVVNRPDMPALMFGALGILLIGLGQESRRWSSLILGTICLVLGFFFKQTAAVCAVVPIVALALHWRRPSLSQTFWAVFPLGVMVALIQGMRFVNPTMYRSMILMPKAFALNHPGTVRAAMEMLIDSPLFLLVAADWIKNETRSLREQPRLLWIVASFIIMFPFSAVTSAKVGGTWNSQLPALLTMTAFVVFRLPRLSSLLDQPDTQPLHRFALGSFLAALMIVSLFPHISRKHGLILPRTPVGAAYRQVLARTAELPGVVISPEDPTIALFARGHLGRNLYNEYDYHLVNGDFPKYPPQSALKEIRNADYLVDVRWYFHDLLTDSIIAPLGFEPVADPGFDEVNFRLWRRKASLVVQASPSPNDEPPADSRSKAPRLGQR